MTEPSTATSGLEVLEINGKPMTLGFAHFDLVLAAGELRLLATVARKREMLVRDYIKQAALEAAKEESGD